MWYLRKKNLTNNNEYKAFIRTGNHPQRKTGRIKKIEGI